MIEEISQEEKERAYSAIREYGLSVGLPLGDGGIFEYNPMGGREFILLLRDAFETIQRLEKENRRFKAALFEMQKEAVRLSMLIPGHSPDPSKRAIPWPDEWLGLPPV